MNDVAIAFYNAINNNITVQKNGVDTDVRLYFGLAPPKTKYPYITYLPTDENPIHFLDDDPLSETNWDFKIWGSDVLEIGTIFQELIDIFNSNDLDADFVGTFSSTGMAMIVEINEPNNIVYSRIVECTVLTGKHGAINVNITSISTLGHGETAIVTFTFGKTVTGFTESDIAVTNGTISGFTGSGNSYSVNVTAPGSGTGNIVISISADVVTEGNFSDALSIPYG